MRLFAALYLEFLVVYHDRGALDKFKKHFSRKDMVEILETLGYYRSTFILKSQGLNTEGTDGEVSRKVKQILDNFYSISES